MSQDELKPEDFLDSVVAVVKACEGVGARETAVALAQAGLLGVIAPEAVGGLDLDIAFATPLTAAVTRDGLPFHLVETMLLSRHLPTRLSKIVSGIVAGEVLATIGWFSDLDIAPVEDGYHVSGVVAAAPLADRADFVLAALPDGGCVLIDLRGPGTPPVMTSEFDVTAPEGELRLERYAVLVDHVLEAPLWDRLVKDALVLRAAAILGCAEAAFKRACEYSVTRKQFGRILAHNQAIRHLLSRGKLGLEGLRAAISRAERASAEDNLSPRSAFLAAAQVGPSVIETAIQIHGGIGFTWELPLHLYLRRARSIALQADPHRLADGLAQDFIMHVASRHSQQLSHAQ